MLDLKSKLTAVVITSGEQCFGLCMDALRKQDCLFNIEIIKDIAPLDRAFQAGLDIVKTPYYVEVDADMVLKPFAIRKLYDSILREPPEVMMVALPLLDVHLNLAIVGVKIFRTAIAKKFPYRESFACEVDQLERAKVAGYTYRVHGGLLDDKLDCVGTHGIHLVRREHERDLFERYQTLFKRYRLDPKAIGWLAPWLQIFLERYQKRPNEVDLFAFLGAVTGLTSDLSQCNSEKDFRRKRLEYNALKKHLIPLGGPTELNIYVTAKCDHRCWFCRRGLDGVEETPDMTPGILKKTLMEFPSIQRACLAGFGEPLLHPGLADLVKVLNEHEISPNIITNGSLLADRAEELSKTKIGMITVSLNAVTAEEHERTHKVQKWDRILDGVRRVALLWFCRVGISMVVTKQNYKSIPAFIRLGASVGVTAVSFVNLLPHGNTGDSLFWDSVITKEDIGIVEEIDRYKGDPYAHLVLHWPVPISKDASLCPHTCDSPWTTVGVDGRGDYTPCRRILPPCKSYMRGAKPSVWNGEAFRDVRGSVLGEGGVKDLCARCWGNWA